MAGRDHIETFESWWGVSDHQLVAFANPSSTRDRTPPSGQVAEHVRAGARVNHGRWIADCPWGDGGAELVNTTTGLFFCCECRNASVGHALIPVEIPADRATIEQLLLARPDESTRNWHPGEQLEQLAGENARHLEE